MFLNHNIVDVRGYQLCWKNIEIAYYYFSDNITPTVELNALAMKRGEPTVYTFVEVPMFTYAAHNNYSYHRGVYTQVGSFYA